MASYSGGSQTRPQPPDPRPPLLVQRGNFNLAEEDLRSFGLENDFAASQAALSARINNFAVDEHSDFVAFADHFLAGPLAVGTFDIVLAAEAKFVRPIDVACEPVDSSTGKFSRCRFGVVNVLPVPVFACRHRKFRFYGVSILVKAANQYEVTRAALDDLTFDRSHPGAIKILRRAAVGSLAVNENSAVLSAIFATSPCHGSPPPFGHQMVVGKLFFGNKRTEVLSAYPNRWRAVDCVHDRD